MRYLVLSDIHANLQALDAVLAAAPPRLWDRLLVLGDLVGYGADPNAVIARVRALRPAAIVRGNHDKTAAGVEQAESFNRIARRAVEWTRKALAPDNLAYLAALPTGPRVVDDLVEISHGTPADEDLYLVSESEAHVAFARAARPLCFYGHTHVPAVYTLEESGQLVFVGATGHDHLVRLPLEPRGRYLINPGSVGQPRDGDPRAAYAVIDTDRGHLDMCRVTYPVEQAQARILDAGLPAVLAERLALGR